MKMSVGGATMMRRVPRIARRFGRELRPVPELEGKLGDLGEIEDDGEGPVMRRQGAGGGVQVDGYLPGEDAAERRQQHLVGLIEEQAKRVVDSITRHRLTYTTGRGDG